MADAIGAIKCGYFRSFDAVKLYTNTQNHVVSTGKDSDAFKNTVGMLGLYLQPMDGNIGTFNGQPPSEYNEFGEELQRNFCIFG